MDIHITQALKLNYVLCLTTEQEDEAMSNYIKENPESVLELIEMEKELLHMTTSLCLPKCTNKNVFRTKLDKTLASNITLHNLKYF